MKHIQNEVNHMEFLKIEDGQGKYSIDGENWVPIDQIDKSSLLTLLESSLNDDFEMEEFVKENIKNPAHQIIYENIYEKLSDLSEKKSQFKDESQSLYSEAYEKYKL